MWMTERAVAEPWMQQCELLEHIAQSFLKLPSAPPPPASLIS